MSQRILVVDDEPCTCYSLKLALKIAGYEVDTACDGREALLRIVQAEHSSFNLIVTDIQMANMGGLELIQWLRTMEIPTPVLAITGYGAAKTEMELTKKGLLDLTRKGLLDFIDKPFEPETLVCRIRSILWKNSSKARERTLAELVTHVS